MRKSTASEPNSGWKIFYLYLELNTVKFRVTFLFCSSNNILTDGGLFMLATSIVILPDLNIF